MGKIISGPGIMRFKLIRCVKGPYLKTLDANLSLLFNDKYFHKFRDINGTIIFRVHPRHKLERRHGKITFEATVLRGTSYYWHIPSKESRLVNKSYYHNFLLKMYEGWNAYEDWYKGYSTLSGIIDYYDFSEVIFTALSRELANLVIRVIKYSVYPDEVRLSGEIPLSQFKIVRLTKRELAGVDEFYAKNIKKFQKLELLLSEWRSIRVFELLISKMLDKLTE